MSTPRQTEYAIDPLFVQRWSPRAFTGEPIETETLLGFFEAARWAPSAFNAQPWRFVYGLRGTPAFGPIFESLIPFNQAWAQHASALVAVLSRQRWVPPGKQAEEAIPSHAFDTGAAWAAFALQATRAGWHAHGMGGFDRDRLRRALAVPEDHELQAVVAVGRRSDDLSQLPEALRAREQPSPRRPLATQVAEGRFAFVD